MRTSSSLHLAVTAVFALMLSQTASADWKRDYDRGVKAVEDGNWAEAEALMRSALAEEPRAEARKRFQGTVWKPYLPHYYAGLAASRQGRCEQALAYWRDRTGLEAIAGVGELSAQQGAGVAECTRRLAANTAPATSPGTRPNATDTRTSGSTSSIASTPAPRPRVTATTSTSTPPTSTTTRPPTSTVASTSSPPPSSPAKPGPAPAPTKPTPAPAALVEAVESFLGGRYDAVARLDPGGLADGRSRAQAFLLRAAARYTLAELNGDANTRQQAQQDVRAARAANASLAPDAVMFSPRFRDFWKQSQ